MRKWIVILAMCVAPAAAAQKKFVLVSFNTLHYGWGIHTAEKDQAITDVAAAAKADVIVLQEIMAQATFGGLPANNVIFVVSNAYGTSRYQERYVILLKNTFTNRGTVPVTGSFSRPPLIQEVRLPNSTITYYIGDFHAIWGRRQSQRTAEATEICKALQSLGPNIALGGDWNLTAAQVLANATCLAEAQPTGLTTLNRAGTKLSSSYDHAVTFEQSKLKISSPDIYGPRPQGRPTWRKTVSDHLPVSVEYTYK